LIQNIQINKCDTIYKQNIEHKNHMIISICKIILYVEI
jgi:hypothetical protein